MNVNIFDERESGTTTLLLIGDSERVLEGIFGVMEEGSESKKYLAGERETLAC